MKSKSRKPKLKISSVVKRLTGVIKNKKVTREDYRKHLEKKYL